jgi:competence protein ComEC
MRRMSQPTAQNGAAQRRPPALPYQPLVIVVLAAAVGIGADRQGAIPLWACFSTAFAAVAAWFALWRRRRPRRAALALLLAVAGTAAAWHHCRWYLFARDDLGHFARAQPQPVCLEALALRAARAVPAPRNPSPMRTFNVGDRTRLLLEVVGIRDGKLWRPAAGRVELWVAGIVDHVRAGDRLRVFALLDTPSRAMNAGEFDFAEYLRGDRQLCHLNTEHPECVTLLGGGSSWSPRRLIDNVRLDGRRSLARYLDPRRSSLAAAVLLGAREQLDPEQSEAFMETGTVHLLVVAGLHVGILVAALWLLLRHLPLPRAWAATLVALVVAFYMLLTDAEPPVVRATVLVLSVCLALAVGRRTLTFNVLAAAALVVLAINPADLFHVGAQLSFLSVAGLAWFAQRPAQEQRQPALSREIEASRSWPARWLRRVARWLWRPASVGLVLWPLTLPLVMARFHLLTPIAPLVNALVWIPMVVAMTGGLALLLLGRIPLVGPLCGLVSNAAFRSIDALVDTARGFWGGHFWVPGPDNWWLVGFYGGLALLAAVPCLRPPRRWCVALLALWIAVGFAAAQIKRPRGELRCAILSVGHGSAVVLELPSGRTMLYDAGELTSPAAAAKTVAGYLWARGHTHVDAIVLSHADVDHCNALPDLLERFSVGVVYVSPVMFEESTPALDALRQAIQQARVPIRVLRAGDRLDGGPGCTLEVLHPARNGLLSTTNANSLVLAAQYAGRRIVLPGDLESPGLDDLLAEEPYHCDVLMAPHHGSRRGNATGLVGWTTPEWIVISGSHGRDYPEVEETYHAIGRKFYHTADAGAVTVTIRGGQVALETFVK